MRGRGRERLSWADAVYRDLPSEFRCLPNQVLQFKIQILASLVRRIISNSTYFYYISTLPDPEKGELYIDFINTNWIKRIMQANTIVSNAQLGNLQPFKKKIQLVEREIAHRKPL